MKQKTQKKHDTFVCSLVFRALRESLETTRFNPSSERLKIISERSRGIFLLFFSFPGIKFLNAFTRMSKESISIIGFSRGYVFVFIVFLDIQARS
jgi:hypothetical protein